MERQRMYTGRFCLGMGRDEEEEGEWNDVNGEQHLL